MVLIWKGKLNKLSDFEKNLDKKSKEFYDIYKDSIIDFFNKIDKDGFLNTKFKQKDVDRFGNSGFKLLASLRDAWVGENR